MVGTGYNTMKTNAPQNNSFKFITQPFIRKARVKFEPHMYTLARDIRQCNEATWLTEKGSWKL